MFAPPRRIRIINHTSHRLSSSDFNFPMPRASMPAAQHQTADKTTSTEDLDASQRTPCTLLTKGCNSNGKNDLTRGTSLEPQASLNLLNTSDGASRRHAASFGDLAPRSTIRRASLAQVQVSAHQASSSSRSREQHCQHGSWTESTSQAIPLQEGQKSSGSRYFKWLQSLLLLNQIGHVCPHRNTVPPAWNTLETCHRAQGLDVPPSSNSIPPVETCHRAHRLAVLSLRKSLQTLLLLNQMGHVCPPRNAVPPSWNSMWPPLETCRRARGLDVTPSSNSMHSLTTHHRAHQFAVLPLRRCMPLLQRHHKTQPPLNGMAHRCQHKAIRTG